VHRVPAYGLDPLGWLEVALRVLRSGGHDVLLPTQEQAALLAREASAVPAGLAVPPFESLLRVQDKLAARETLEAAGLPQPPAFVAHSPNELTAPAFVKAPIGTATMGVAYVRDAAELPQIAHRMPFEDGGVLVQEPVAGPLAMIQAVFDRGRLVAWHANLRLREGVRGGASHKESVALPAVAEHLSRLGEALDWHGALSLDAIVTQEGPCYIDVNPRLVEPGNAWHSGTDLVGAMLSLSLGCPVEPAPPSRSGVRTHQTLLSVLGAAQNGGGRRGVLRELALAVARRGPYAGSSEELTPVRSDPLAALPVAAAAAATLVAPGSHRFFTGGAVSAYALTPEAWRQIAGAEY
jgi:biotin carboxylase